MRLKRRSLQLLALVLSMSLLAAACGDDDDSGSEGTDSSEESSETRAGGEFVDYGTVVGSPLEHIDPALNTTLDGFQITNAIYDGLTELDFADPENPALKPLVAESWESNADATEWVFKIKDGLKFSDGTPLLPSSFQLAWERGSDPDFAGDYSYLFNFLEGGKEKVAGDADTISGVTADDAAMTLTTKLSAPYANWPTVAGFQLFYPMPTAVSDLANQNDWENGVMVGNGPFKMESARTTEQIVLVKNDEWAGDQNGDTWDDRLDKITFVTQSRPRHRPTTRSRRARRTTPPSRPGAGARPRRTTPTRSARRSAPATSR